MLWLQMLKMAALIFPIFWYFRFIFWFWGEADIYSLHKAVVVCVCGRLHGNSRSESRQLQGCEAEYYSIITHFKHEQSSHPSRELLLNHNASFEWAVAGSHGALWYTVRVANIISDNVSRQPHCDTWTVELQQVVTLSLYFEINFPLHSSWLGPEGRFELDQSGIYLKKQLDMYNCRYTMTDPPRGLSLACLRHAVVSLCRRSAPVMSRNRKYNKLKSFSSDFCSFAQDSDNCGRDDPLDAPHPTRDPICYGGRVGAPSSCTIQPSRSAKKNVCWKE